MLTTYFDHPFTLSKLRSGPAGAHLDDFAGHLKQQGYSRSTVRSHVREGKGVEEKGSRGKGLGSIILTSPARGKGVGSIILTSPEDFPAMVDSL